MSRNRKHPRRYSEEGFSLIEMIAATMILALAVGVGASALGRRNTVPAPLETARTLQSLLLQARSDAILRGADTAFQIHIGNRFFAYPRDGKRILLPAGMDIRMLAGGEFTDRDGESLVLFRADGSSSGADILLTDGKRADARIDVNWLTGIARIKAR